MRITVNNKKANLDLKKKKKNKYQVSASKVLTQFSLDILLFSSRPSLS